VFNSFLPAMVGIDTTSGACGQLRGLSRWNLDVALSRKFRFSERWSTTFSAQLFNAFNTVQFRRSFNEFAVAAIVRRPEFAIKCAEDHPAWATPRLLVGSCRLGSANG
jgi:hypothetical protein